MTFDKVPVNTCQLCDKVLDAALCISDGSKELPKPGDFTLCGYCRAAYRFQDDGSIRLATLEECERMGIVRHFRPQAS